MRFGVRGIGANHWAFTRVLPVKSCASRPAHIAVEIFSWQYRAVCLIGVLCKWDVVIKHGCLDAGYADEVVATLLQQWVM